MFKKGQSGNPKGRPMGAKNRNCMNPVFWYNLIADLSEKMPQDRQLSIAFKALELLMPKVNNLPNTPQDSLNNAVVAQNLLNALESPPPVPVNAGTDPNSH